MKKRVWKRERTVLAEFEGEEREGKTVQLSYNFKNRIIVFKKIQMWIVMWKLVSGLNMIARLSNRISQFQVLIMHSILSLLQVLWTSADNTDYIWELPSSVVTRLCGVSPCALCYVLPPSSALLQDTSFSPLHLALCTQFMVYSRFPYPLMCMLADM